MAERRDRVKRHEIAFDKKERILTVRVEDAFTMEEAIELENKMNEIVPGDDKYKLLIDVRKSSAKLDKDIRRRLQGQMADERIANVAVLVSNPAVRMIGKVIIAAMGKSADTRFFSTDEEALLWLKGE